MEVKDTAQAGEKDSMGAAGDGDEGGGGGENGAPMESATFEDVKQMQLKKKLTLQERRRISAIPKALARKPKDPEPPQPQGSWLGGWSI